MRAFLSSPSVLLFASGTRALESPLSLSLSVLGNFLFSSSRKNTPGRVAENKERKWPVNLLLPLASLVIRTSSVFFLLSSSRFFSFFLLQPTGACADNRCHVSAVCETYYLPEEEKEDTTLSLSSSSFSSSPSKTVRHSSAKQEETERTKLFEEDILPSKSLASTNVIGETPAREGPKREGEEEEKERLSFSGEREEKTRRIEEEARGGETSSSSSHTKKVRKKSSVFLSLLLL